ncbi:hypothetical protein BpHYR1_006666 [Brachionus plicatilis]|uniref:Uncharacterized protein n=1 Tax=Brachionus plicatilis TaxID=10195 RepID=A0A3M7QP96_BRAPC|nr:hypothetical protein BpHYR1_006666 [Brachionus plicatilis]
MVFKKLVRLNNEEALRIPVYAFFNEKRSLGKIFTVTHFSPDRKQGSGQTSKKMTKVQLNKLKKRLLITKTTYDSVKQPKISKFLRGISEPIIRESGLAVNQTVYLDFIQRRLLPFIKKHHSGGNYNSQTWRALIMPIKSSTT